MIDLVAADVHRVLWRPLTRALGVIAIVVIGFGGVVVFFHTAKHPFSTLTGLRGGLGDAATPLALGGFILGASVLGADFTSRAFTTLLIWEPRRQRVLAARAAACAAVSAVSAVVVLAVLIIALLPTVFAHGVGSSPTGTWYLSTAALAIRCALLAAAASVVGTSLAAVGGSTAAALAGAAVYMLVVEQAALATVPSIGRWLLSVDALSWIAITAHPTISGRAGNTDGHTVMTAGLLLLAVVVALQVLATFVLRRRDIS
jgi:ABC-2 type transport system permease protein